MHPSSFGSFLVRSIAALSLVCISSCNCFAIFHIEEWVDSLIEIAQSYDDLIVQASKFSAAESCLATESTDRVDEPQGDEMLLDCLANRLLAEEYQPYDFDIRETFWCKGSSITNLKCDSQLSNAILSEDASSFQSTSSAGQDSQLQTRWLPFVWIETFQTQYLLELQCRLQVESNTLLAYLPEGDRDERLLVSSEIAAKDQDELQEAISMQVVFGSTVIPNSIQITDAEYATIAFQTWNEVQEIAKQNWELIQFRFNQLRPISGFQLQDLAKSMLRNLRIARR